jgi:hypothetical protein
MRVRYDTKELIWKIWSAARLGQMITLIGPEIGIDEFAAAVKSTGREVLSHLGSRYHRIYYAIKAVKSHCLWQEQLRHKV